ncbi:MAG TPA: dihydrofolate reductase family protein [Candidatus Thermoplasmatota archaeon]|nr:dihydrofolate reductase family protein [Candidatus Thermoplasmatota archaeon]
MGKGKVLTGATMSLDGYISGLGESGFDLLFRWYGDGDVVVKTADPALTFHLTPENAAVWRDLVSRTGALVVGRHLFDITNGWNGRHPMDVPVFVVTHRPPAEWQEEHPGAPFTFVTEGVPAAIAQAKDAAGPKDVSVAAGSIGSQALEAGLVDEVGITLAPVVLGGGRTFFQALGRAPYAFGDPEVVTARGVTHLRYPIARRRRKADAAPGS